MIIDHPESHARSQAPALPPSRQAPRRARPRLATRALRWALVTHKWAGLAASAWLMVLGITGFLIDHGDWRPLWSVTVPDWIVPAEIRQSAARNVARLFQVDPMDPRNAVAGGPRGLWHARDGGATWRPSVWPDPQGHQVLALEPDPAGGWETLWIGTEDGLFLSHDGGAHAERAGLAGIAITALSPGASPDGLVGVADKSRVFTVATARPDAPTWIALAGLGDKTRPETTSLYRLAIELHFGRGLAPGWPSTLLNDWGGIGLALLAATGIAYWLAPRLRRLRRSRPGPRGLATTRWLYRAHGPILGLTSGVMILHLAVTGILIGHSRDIGPWLKAIALPTGALPPAFAMAGWDGWIDSVAAWPGEPRSFTIGSRIGLFTTRDGGATWSAERDGEGRPIPSATRLRRIGADLLVPNGMAGPTFIAGAGAPRREVTTSRHFMPSDVTAMGDRYAWRSGGELFVTDATGRELEIRAWRQPDGGGVPLFTFLVRLHTGAVFSPEWKWANDVFATLAVILVATGLVRWWRRPWA